VHGPLEHMTQISLDLLIAPDRRAHRKSLAPRFGDSWPVSTRPSRHLRHHYGSSRCLAGSRGRAFGFLIPVYLHHSPCLPGCLDGCIDELVECCGLFRGEALPVVAPVQDPSSVDRLSRCGAPTTADPRRLGV
jgi:hypothetical protein